MLHIVLLRILLGLILSAGNPAEAQTTDLTDGTWSVVVLCNIDHDHVLCQSNEEGNAIEYFMEGSVVVVSSDCRKKAMSRVVLKSEIYIVDDEQEYLVNALVFEKTDMDCYTS